MIETEGGFKPKLFLLADAGFEIYSTTIEAKVDFVKKNEDLVQRFVEASIIGCYNYLYGDNETANPAIKKDNPEITDSQIAFSIKTMKEFGLIESGEALEKGIGCMNAGHITAFYDQMVKAGVVNADLDVEKVYTTEFICKGVGMDIKN